MTINAPVFCLITFHVVYLPTLFSFALIYAYQCYWSPLSDWIPSVRRDDTRFTLSRRRSKRSFDILTPLHNLPPSSPTYWPLLRDCSKAPLNLINQTLAHHKATRTRRAETNTHVESLTVSTARRCFYATCIPSSRHTPLNSSIFIWGFCPRTCFTSSSKGIFLSFFLPPSCRVAKIDPSRFLHQDALNELWAGG